MGIGPNGYWTKQVVDQIGLDQMGLDQIGIGPNGNKPFMLKFEQNPMVRNM